MHYLQSRPVFEDFANLRAEARKPLIDVAYIIKIGSILCFTIARRALPTASMGRNIPAAPPANRTVESADGFGVLARVAEDVASWRVPADTRPDVGVDMVSVAEVAASLDRFGDRYARRVYTADESRYCRSATGMAASARFAARFAAKEAAVKALRPIGPWARWTDIEVRRHPSGRCWLKLHGAAAALARRRGIRHLALSMSHDGDHAAAIVLAWRHHDVTSGRG